MPCANDETADKSSSKGSWDSCLQTRRVQLTSWWTRVQVEASSREVSIRVHRTIRRWHRFRSPQTTQCMVMWARNCILAWETAASSRSDTMKLTWVFHAARLEWGTPQNMCAGPNCGQVGEALRSVLIALLGNWTIEWDPFVPEPQVFQIGYWGAITVGARSRCHTNAVGRDRGNAQTQAPEVATQCKQRRKRFTSAHASPFQVMVWSLCQGEGSGRRTSTTDGPTKRWSQDGYGLLLLGESDRFTACESSLESFWLPVGCSVLSHGGERRWPVCVGGGAWGDQVHRQDSVDHHEWPRKRSQESGGHDQGQQNSWNCRHQHSKRVESQCWWNRASKL